VSDGAKILYRRARVSGAEDVDAFGLDASPALSVIAGALGAVGPKPDLVLSGSITVSTSGAPSCTRGQWAPR